MKTSQVIMMALAVFITVMAVHDKLDFDSRHAIRKVPTYRKLAALTFDDGPHYKTTPEILAVLKEKNVHATFFVLGVNVEQYPELLLREVADGHEIAVHAYHHRHLNGLDKAKIIEEFERTEKALQKITSKKPVLFRPPGGRYDDNLLASARELGYTTILWSVNPLDWTRPAPEKVVEIVLKNVFPGCIILLHDGQYPLPTASAINTIIDRLRDEGYELITVGELMQHYEVKHSVLPLRR